MSFKVVKQFLAGVLIAFVATFSHAADEHPAQAMVVESTTALLEVLKNEGERIKNDKAFLAAQVDEHIVPGLDFDSMTKLAVGKFWRQADDTQRTNLITEFKSLLLNTYTNALTLYSGESIEFQPFRAEKRDDRAVVRSVFKQSGANEVPVMYKLRDKDGWLIYDIEVDNISLVTSYRTAFSAEIEKGGIDGLLETMKQKNAEASSN